MAKINQIQQAISELDGGAFQKLADSYLLRKGYPQINSIGSFAGSNKVIKGNPDSLIQTTDGKYIFAEYTTISEKKVCGKFMDDISKCLDESKTGIAITKIKEIVLCYTSEMTAKNIDKLRKQCEAVGVNLNLFGLGAISYDLLEKYPSISKDHLGIEVDTGQIVSLDKFISLYEKNKFTTTLKTVFHFRQEEKRNLLLSIEKNNLVIITGHAGVGKSRIAIECYQQFIKENESYKAFCIFNQGIDLFEDVKSYFSDSGDYLIFVDDANRISGFQYILQLLQTKRSDQNFKIIVTVRDYALDKIRDACKPIESAFEISLSPFTDKEIKKLLQDEFEINNHLYLDRIIDIAHGNPRIAVMAAQVAKDSNTLDSIKDVSELYDTYFSSIKSDLDAMKDVNILKVAGVVSFFRSVDRTNNNLMSDINEIFGISVEDFWEVSKKLHGMEVLDMFENEVVKISDQVLATYLFYLVFFKEKYIDFSILINDLFPQFKQRLIDALNPILNTFNFDETKKTMESSVDKAWAKIQAKDVSIFLQLIDVFWFLKPTETLIFIQNKIKSINSQEICIDEIKFKADSSSSLPEFLSTLSLFRLLGINELNLSLDLFLKYARKQPQDTSIILHCFVDKYGFQPDSYRYGYHVQHAVVDKILEYCNSGKNEYFTRMFIALAESYLHTHFSSTKSGRGHTITFTQFDLVETSELLNLRKKILTNLFSFYKGKYFQQHILKLLLSHTQSGLNVSVSSIVENDSKLIASFCKNDLDPTNLYHCIIVQQYLRLLKRFNILTEEKLKALFQSDTYALYDLLTNKFKKIELKLSHEAYREYKKKKIAEFTKSYSKEDYDVMLHELSDILQILDGRSKWQIDQGIISILEELAKRNPSLFCEVIKNYIQQGDYLIINPWVVVSNLILSCGSTASFNIIVNADFPSKNRWLFSYYQHLSKDDIKKEQIDALSELYQTSDYKCINNDVDFILKYESIKKGFVNKIVKIIIDRANTAPDFAHVLSFMFNKHTKINKQLLSLFSSRSTILEDAYMVVDRIDPHADYDGATLSELLDKDQGFIDRYLDDKFTRKKYLSSHDDNRDYSFIWLRDDYMNVMQRVSETVFKYEQEGRCFGYYESFFSKNVNPQTDKTILERQDRFLLGEISSKYNNREFVRLLFSVIVGFESNRKLIFYKTFLYMNKEFNDFKNLPFEPTISIWSGSAVPMLQQKIEFYEKIISICSSVEFLNHRQFIEQKIRDIRHQIQHEKKKDFTEA
jgi:energy-coupling factor transporter ATP-binding protein EcfA2